MKVALAQINTTIGDIDGNVAKIIDYGRRAQALKADLVVFPELAITGYPPRDLLFKAEFIQANLLGLRQIAAALKDIPTVVGYVDVNPGTGRPLFNACGYLAQGKLVYAQYKTLLPTYDVFDEDRYFEPASASKLVRLGDSMIGLTICEDIWNDEQASPKLRYQQDPLIKVAALRPDFIVNISASPFSLGKEHLRHDLVANQALRHQVPLIYVNQVGGNDELIFDGRSIVCDATGKLIAQANSFAEDLLIVDLASKQAAIKDSPVNEVDNAYRALVLGTGDYVRKCGFQKVIIGLSGGIDSAVTAVIAAVALGAENVLGVAMPSKYSSKASLDDACQLANNLNLEFRVVPIIEPAASFTNLLQGEFKGLPEDVTEENIQARIRAVILMALSNKLGYLLLTTGNKSELAVGYCTLYGDMCGGLAVISDLPKTMVYKMAELINLQAGKELIPRSTIEKPPSAELRPNQKDQDTLPPYEVLDDIIDAYVEKHLSREDIVRLGHDAEVVSDVIRRIEKNEYKRHQAAPGLKVTTQAFGLGWRMPIAQKLTGGSKMETLLRNPG